MFTMTNLKRLDIGWNRISTIPTDISKLVRLEELWINSNPLKEIPHDVSKCTNLRVIDLRDTQVKNLPYSLGRLKRMVQLKTEIDFGFPKVCSNIMNYLSKQDQLEQRKKKLFVRLRDTVYRELSRKKDDSNEMIRNLVDRTFCIVSDDDEQKSLIRNAGRLFPADIDNASIQSIHKTLVSLRNQNEKTRLKAEVELRIRQIYFGTFFLSSSYSHIMHTINRK